MSAELVREYLKNKGLEDKIVTHRETIDTVEHAAQQLGCSEGEIAKTLSFHVGDRIVLIVTAGDVKIDNQKYKARFGAKARMLSCEEAEPLTGHPVGGVCPFAANSGVEVYLDESLRRFGTVFPACGSSNSAIELTPDELEEHSDSLGWVDVCKGWE